MINAIHGGGQSDMTTRWRRRCMCILIAGQPAPAALRHVSATGAFLETNARPELGASIQLLHPDAGSIVGRIDTVSLEGVGVTFERSEQSVAFALAAIVADMSRPAA